MRALRPKPMGASKTKALLTEVLGISDPKLGSILFLVGFVVFFGWFADTTLHYFQSLFDAKIAPPSHASLMVGTVPFLLMIVLSWHLWVKAQKKTMEVRAKDEIVQPHEGVILFLSEVKDKVQLEMVEKGDDTVFEMERFPWLQCIRGLDAHKDTLKHVWAVCSPESQPQFKCFKRLFEDIYPDVVFESVSEKGVPFANVKMLVDEVEEIFHRLPADIDESEMIIDITGGQKTASIAGMLVSLVSDKRDVQYVLSDNNNTFEVRTYGYDIKGFRSRLEANK